MHESSLQVIHDDGMFGDSERLAQKYVNLFGFEMMQKQSAANYIVRGIAKGKREGIRYDRSIVFAEMTHRTICDRDIYLDAEPLQSSGSAVSNVAAGSGNIEHSHATQPFFLGHTSKQGGCRRNAAKVAVQPLQVMQRIRDFFPCAAVAIKKFRHDHALHTRASSSSSNCL